MKDNFEAEVVDVPAKVKIPEGPPDDIANAIGRLSVATAQLEYVMRMWIKTILGGDFHGAMIFSSKLRFEQLKDIASSLLTQRSNDSKLIERFRDLTSTSKELFQKRNIYIHGLFATDGSGSPIILTISRDVKKGLVSKAINPDAELVCQLARAIAEKAESLEKLRHNVKVEPRQQTDPEVSAT
jgi:hypothetical protein